MKETSRQPRRGLQFSKPAASAHFVTDPSSGLQVKHGALPFVSTHGRAKRRGRILCYKIDMVSVSTVILAIGMQLTAYFLSWPWFATLPIMLAVRELHLVEHNHAHLPIFRQAMLNEILGWLCFISNGVPLECYELHHVQNHHRYTQQFNDNARDWSSTFGFTGTHYPDKPIGRTYYCASYALLAWLHCWIEVLRRPGSPVFRRFMRSYFLCIGISAALLIIDPWNYFLFFAIPWAMVYIGIGSNNYDHHQNCKLTTPYNSANVDLRFPYRLFGFNIGYHVEHHMKPTLHWSLLPEYHDLIKKDIPPDNYVIKPPA